MDFWKCTTEAVTRAVNDLMEKNRRAAMINRLKIVIHTEKESENRAYIQLGKYYYQNLRDPQNGDTETYCAAVEKASTREKRAYAKLDELTAPSDGPTSGIYSDDNCSCSDECECDDECACDDTTEETAAAPAQETEQPAAESPAAPSESAAPAEPAVPAEPATKEEAADDMEDFLQH